VQLTAAGDFCEGVLATLEKRFKLAYHPAMSAALLLDPINFTKGERAPFDQLTPEQLQGAKVEIARITGKPLEDVGRELVHFQLDKWSDTLQQVADVVGEKTKVYNAEGELERITTNPPAMRRNFWTQTMPTFPILTSVAQRLLSLHVTTGAAERNWSVWGNVYTSLRNRLSLEQAKMGIFIKANSGDAQQIDDEVEHEMVLV
jgi:hypothetical protein